MISLIRLSLNLPQIKAAFPNLLTLLRVILVPPLCSAIMNRNLSVLTVTFLAISATDFFDGRIARMLNTQSKFGAALDAVADLAYIMATLYTMTIVDLIPVWFFFMVIAKFFEFIITSLLIARKSEERLLLVFDHIGRIAACLFFVTPMVIPLLDITKLPGSSAATQIVIGLTALLSISSSIGRIVACVRSTKLMESRYLWIRNN